MNIEGLLAKQRDKLLVKQSLAGNATAFARLLSFYQKRVEAIGMSFFHNRADAEDFAQDVFSKVFTHLATFKQQSSFSTWLTKIAYTTAINAKNRNRTYESIADETLIPAIDRSPEEMEIRRLTAQAVKDAVRELPPDYAVCLDFYFFYDIPYDEIAIITGFPVNTIKSHIFRAKKLLRQTLQQFQ